MFGLPPVRHRLLLVLILVAFASGSAAARGQDKSGRQDEPEDPSTLPPLDAPVMAVERGPTREAWAARLTTEISRIDQSCQLAAAQKKKLELAGRADIKRAFDYVEGAARRLHAARDKPGQADEIRKELTEIQRRFAEALFRDGSMFAKTIPSVLHADQLARYRAERLARRRFRHRARVDLAVEVFSAAAGCSDEQRERLAQLLLEKTRLPTRPDQEFLVVLGQAARLPEEQLRPIFDAAQWSAVSRLRKTLGEQLQGELRQAVLEPDDPAEPIAAREGRPATGKK
jgi:hypothetical protein